MVSSNKIPGNWLNALEMADKIAEIIKETRDNPTVIGHIEALKRIAQLIGMEEEVEEK